MSDIKLQTSSFETDQLAALKKSANEFFAMVVNGGEGNVGGPLGDVWTNAKDLDVSEAKLVLLPLDRIGVESGKSGQRVLVGYWRHATNHDIWPSKPLVVKVSPSKLHPKFKEKRKELLDEAASAKPLRRYFAQEAFKFAYPLHVDDHGDDLPAVLWSPFRVALSTSVTSATA